MSDVWYCINESDTGDWVTSIWDGLGIPAAQIPSTGESGAAYLFNDIAGQGASPTDEFSSTILSVPPVGVFTHDEYSAISFTGAADGVYTATYMAERNSVPYLNPETAGGEWVITMTIGNAQTLANVLMPQMSVTASASTTFNGNLLMANITMPQMIAFAAAEAETVTFLSEVLTEMPQFTTYGLVSNGGDMVSSVALSMPAIQALVMAQMPKRQNYGTPLEEKQKMVNSRRSSENRNKDYQPIEREVPDWYVPKT